MSKSLLVDLTKKLGSMPLNNVEDIALGPELPDGRQFGCPGQRRQLRAPAQITQFLVLLW